MSLVAVSAVYLAWVPAHGGVAEVGWARPLVTAFVALVAVGVGASLAVTVAAALRARAGGGSGGGGAEFDRFDERDAGVRDRGARLSRVVLGLWVVAVFVLAVLQIPYVWIAHGLFAAVVTAGLTDAVARVAAYRRGW